MDTFQQEVEFTRDAQSLTTNEYNELRRMSREGLYEITIRTRTRAMTMPVHGEAVDNILIALEDTVVARHKQLSELVKTLESIAAKEADDARKDRREAERK